MSIEKNLAEYISRNGIKLAEISRGTGIPYMYLYNSLFNKNRTREMKAKEILEVCIFINVDPRDLFAKFVYPMYFADITLKCSVSVISHENVPSASMKYSVTYAVLVLHIQVKKIRLAR